MYIDVEKKTSNFKVTNLGGDVAVVQVIYIKRKGKEKKGKGGKRKKRKKGKEKEWAVPGTRSKLCLLG